MGLESLRDALLKVVFDFSSFFISDERALLKNIR